MKDISTIHNDQEESGRMMFEPRLADEMRLHEEPRLYPQRKRAWDKLMADIDQAHATLRISRSSVVKGTKPSN